MEISELKVRNKIRKGSVRFRSVYKHLNDHNGFRDGELHLLVGSKGSGKSSLFREWIIECVRQGKKVYVRLSEDKKTDYLDEISKFFDDHEGVIFKNLIIDSDLGLTEDEQKTYFDDMEMRIKNCCAEIVFFDNFTTSIMTRQGISEEAKNAIKLRELADKLEIPIVVAAHTEKAFKGRSVASGDDVRGNATIANVAAYIYGITVFFQIASRPTVLFTDKARHHTKANKKYYKLIFNTNTESYVKDTDLSYIEMDEIMEQLKKKAR